MGLTWPPDRDVVFGWRSGPPGWQHHLAQYQNAWRLAAGYDALMLIESDIIPPPDCIEKLAALDAEVAIGLYVSRRGEPVWNVLTPWNGKMGQSISFTKEGRKAWGKVIETSGCGFGCALIRGKGLEIMPRDPGKSSYCDWPWYEDLQNQGGRVMADLSVVCGHVHTDGTVLWPTKDGCRKETVATTVEPTDWCERQEAGMVGTRRVKMLRAVGSPYGCPQVGQSIELPAEIAVDWANCGYAELMEDGDGLHHDE